MKDLYNDGLSRFLNGIIKWNLYLERRLTSTGMSDLIRLEMRFRQYKFQLMVTMPGKYSLALV